MVLLFSPYTWFFDVEPVETRLLPSIEETWNKIRQGFTSVFRRTSRDFYQPLNSENREIRLLRILPGRSVEIECELIHALLDDESLQYEALSYTWGRPLFNYRIWINKRPHLVAKNLALALQQLRGAGHSRLIWIDALCINQSNWMERNEQVRLMRDIYTRARKGVVVWLGDDSGYEEAIGLLHQAEGHNNPDAWFAATVGDEQYKSAWYNLSKFLTKDYWERIWIIQEVACSTSISVLCGQHRLNWSILVSADSIFGPEGQLAKEDLKAWYLYEGSKISVNPYVDGALETVTQVVFGESLSHGPMSFSKAPVGPKFLDVTRSSRDDAWKALSLFDLLCVHHGGNATDPRDKVYALVGLADDCQNNEFKIDYRLSEIEASRSVADFLMNKARSLDFLCFSLPCFPPWTRDYYLWKSETQTSALLRTMGTGLVQNTAGLLPKYSAAGHKPAEAFMIPRSELYYRCFGSMESTYQVLPLVKNTIVVKGCCVDEIAGFLDELTTRSETVFVPWIRCLERIPILGWHRRPLMVLSYALLAAAKALAGVYIFLAAITLLGYPPTITEFVETRFSPVQTYRPLSSLNLPPTVPDFPPYPPNSSDWLEEPWAIALADRIKRGLGIVLKTSVILNLPNESDISTISKRDRRIESYWRALVCNRTSEGATAPDEWAQLFQVILNGPPFVPNDFLPSSASQGQPQLSDLERARLYVRPFLITMRRNPRRVFITKKGLIGAASSDARSGDLLCVFWGCSYIVVVKGAKARRIGQHRVGKAPERDLDTMVDSVMRGGAYLDGYMDGQAVQEVQNAQLLEVLFKLH